jgi:hypothetical protein
MSLVPIDSGVKTLQIKPTSDTSVAGSNNATTSPQVELTVGAVPTEMKVGDKLRIPVMVKSTASLRSGVLGLRFDDKKVAIRSVIFGDVFGMGLANTAVNPFLNQNGRMFVSLAASDKASAASEGILAFIEIEALADGKPEISIEKDVLNFVSADGKHLSVSF